MIEIKHKQIQLIALLFVIALALMVIRAYIGILIFSAIVAYFLYPAHQMLSKRIPQNISALLLCILTFGTLIIVLQYGLQFMIQEFSRIYLYVANYNFNGGSQYEDIIRFGITKAVNYISDSLRVLPHIIASFFVFVISLFYFLYEGDRIMIWFKQAVPLDKRLIEKVIKMSKVNVDAFVHVQVLIGITQGILAYIGFSLFGLEYPMLAAIAAAGLSVLPVMGPYLLYIPLGGYLFLEGSTTLGIGLIAYGLIVGSILDYIVRPYFIGKRAGLHPLIIFLGIFGGIELLGVVGIIAGPVLLAIAATFLKELGVNYTKR